MRLLLTLSSLEDPTVIPLNYNYPLSSVIYKLLSAGNPEYSAFLHQEGYVTSDGRPFKLFTFSKLLTPGAEARGNRLLLPRGTRARLYIDSPMFEDFMQSIVMGTFETRTIRLANEEVGGKLRIDSVERVELPPIQSSMKCVMLSPCVIAKARDGVDSGTEYLLPGHPAVNDVLSKNAVSKYGIVRGTPPANAELTIEFDEEYLRRRGGPERVTKLITIKEGRPEETRVRAVLAPFTVSGDPQLIEIVFQAGLGAKNSMGFGMIAPFGEHQG